jgi:NADP-dependent 3-hydroxy acid dehydrogenase YdfG
MSGQLAGAAVLVTGATGNVGWGVAKASAAAGATLILTARSNDARKTLQDDFPTARVVVADMTTASVSAELAKAIGDVGRLDHVVAPIGAWWQRGATLEQDPEELDTLLATYVGAQLRLLHETADSLRASGGSYTLVTGAGGQHVIPNAGLLVVAVRGQYALADVLRTELVNEPFRFNEFRIDARVERSARPGVVPAAVAGEAFVKVMNGQQRSELITYTGD